MASNPSGRWDNDDENQFLSVFLDSLPASHLPPPGFESPMPTEDHSFYENLFWSLIARANEADDSIDAALYGNPRFPATQRYAAFRTLQDELGDQFIVIDARVTRTKIQLMVLEKARGLHAERNEAEDRRVAEEQVEQFRRDEAIQAERRRRARARRAGQHLQAQAEQEANSLQAQADYEQRANAIETDQEARQRAGETMFIQVTPHWFWQCHICGYHNELYAKLHKSYRSWPSAGQWQAACVNSISAVGPDDHICGHERCGWCFDLDENLRPFSYSSGVQITQDDYDEFWGGRLWIERHGVPSGQVTWEEYENFCVHRFGGVPPLMPWEGTLPPDFEHGSGESAGQDAEQATGQDSMYPELWKRSQWKHLKS